jgi:hypothetical protein
MPRFRAGPGCLVSAARFCPRCGAVLVTPQNGTPWSCHQHGEVAPLEGVRPPQSTDLHAAALGSAVPVWLMWPLLPGWTISGIVRAGADGDAAHAVAVACGGPAPLGGTADLVIIAERPGIGLGAGLGGLPHLDPEPTVWADPAVGRVSVSGRPTAMWSVGALDDRAVFVGEADGAWLWMVLWPADAGHLLADGISLIDLREDGVGFDLPCGSVSPRLPGL